MWHVTRVAAAATRAGRVGVQARRVTAAAAAAADVEVIVDDTAAQCDMTKDAALDALAENLNELQLAAFNKARRGENLLLIGAAGTGKSHATRAIRELVRYQDWNVATCAPFGVAACNVNGFTIHSTFALPIAEMQQLAQLPQASPEFAMLRDNIVRHSYKNRRAVWQGLDTLIIDEISTCDALTFSLLDYTARIVKEKPGVPFGGIQVICVGDFLQLPPVQGDWAFNSVAFKHLFTGTSGSVVQLDEVLRQSEDRDFLEMLNYLRTLHPEDKLGQEFVAGLIQSTCRVEGGAGDTGVMRKVRGKDFIRLVPLRAMADEANEQHLAALTEEPRAFSAFDSEMKLDEALVTSHSREVNSGELSQIDEMLLHMLNQSRFEQEMVLKRGARVMQVQNIQNQRRGGTHVGKNMSSHDRIANGHTGVVKEFGVPSHGFQTEDYQLWASLRRRQGLSEEVPLVRWDHNGVTTPVTPTLFTVGDSYSTAGYVRKRMQLPLCLSWAVTAHKCQGMTISGPVHVCLSNTFAAGQIYVALSRSKTGANTWVNGVDHVGRGFAASREALEYLQIPRASHV